MRVLVAGGGIAGLTLAAALHRAGIGCLVLERSRAQRWFLTRSLAFDVAR